MPVFSVLPRFGIPLTFSSTQVRIEVSFLGLHGRAVCDSFLFQGNTVVVQSNGHSTLYFGSSLEFPLAKFQLARLGLSFNVAARVDDLSYTFLQGFGGINCPENGAAFYVQYRLMCPNEGVFWTLSFALFAPAAYHQSPFTFDTSAEHDYDRFARLDADMTNFPLNAVVPHAPSTPRLMEEIEDTAEEIRTPELQGNAQHEVAGLVFAAVLFVFFKWLGFN